MNFPQSAHQQNETKQNLKRIIPNYKLFEELLARTKYHKFCFVIICCNVRTFSCIQTLISPTCFNMTDALISKILGWFKREIVVLMKSSSLRPVQPYCTQLFKQRRQGQ